MYLPSGSNMISGSSGSGSWMTTTTIPTITTNLVRTTDSYYNQTMQDAISVFCLVIMIIVVVLCCVFHTATREKKDTYPIRRYSCDSD